MSHKRTSMHRHCTSCSAHVHLHRRKESERTIPHGLLRFASPSLWNWKRQCAPVLVIVLMLYIFHVICGFYLTYCIWIIEHGSIQFRLIAVCYTVLCANRICALNSISFRLGFDSSPNFSKHGNGIDICSSANLQSIKKIDEQSQRVKSVRP